MPVGLSDKFDANARHQKHFLAGVVLVPVRPHHSRRQETLPVQQPAAAANAAAAAAAVGSMTLNDVLRGTYHARPDRLQEVGGRTVRRRRTTPRARGVVLGLDSTQKFS